MTAGFKPGSFSEAALRVCDLGLVRNIRRAYQLTRQDFRVFETIRGLQRQSELVAKRASRTLDSHHLPGPDGLADASDLVPWIAGRMQWQDAPCIEVAQAMHEAQSETKVPITWGGVWDRELSQLDVHDLEGEIERYVARWRAKHPRPPGHRGYWGPLVDRPHFQVPR